MKPCPECDGYGHLPLGGGDQMRCTGCDGYGVVEEPTGVAAASGCRDGFEEDVWRHERDLRPSYERYIERGAGD